MSGRGAAVALMTLGGVLAVLPAFAWYSTPGAAGLVRATGFSGAGQLLLLPLLGGLAVLAGAALAAARPEGRAAASVWAGALASVSGLIALGFTVWAAAAPSVELTVILADGREVLPGPVELEPAAVIAPFLAGLLVLLGAAVARSGLRR